VRTAQLLLERLDELVVVVRLLEQSLELLAARARLVLNDLDARLSRLELLAQLRPGALELVLAQGQALKLAPAVLHTGWARQNEAGIKARQGGTRQGRARQGGSKQSRARQGWAKRSWLS
jgi:hypothetical protein